jgi:hypothetical protein
MRTEQRQTMRTAHHRMQLRLPRDLHQRLAAAAAHESNTVSAVIRRLVAEGLHRQPK